MAYASWEWVVDKGPIQTETPAGVANNSPSGETLLKWMTMAYFCEGLGYIVSATFLVSAVQKLLNSSPSGNAAWIIAGLAAAVSTIIWPYIARRRSLLQTLIYAYCLQSIGIILAIGAALLATGWYIVHNRYGSINLFLTKKY